ALGFAVGVPPLAPLGLESRAALTGPTPVRERLRGHMERLERGPPQVLFGALDLVGPERSTVSLGRVLLARAAERDMRAHDDERRSLGRAARGGERGVERRQVVSVRDPLHVPAV